MIVLKVNNRLQGTVTIDIIIGLTVDGKPREEECWHLILIKKKLLICSFLCISFMGFFFFCKTKVT